MLNFLGPINKQKPCANGTVFSLNERIIVKIRENSNCNIHDPIRAKINPMKTLKLGAQAPEFTLPDQNNKSHSLSDYKGKLVLLYFYPKDDTEGCTKQACGIRDAFPSFSKEKMTVLGISTDSVKSHKKFEEKYGLPFTLLADEDKKVVKQYGVWGKKKFWGREYMGTLRTSFLIGTKGQIIKIYENVNPETHATGVLKDLTAHA